MESISLSGEESVQHVSMPKNRKKIVRSLKEVGIIPTLSPVSRQNESWKPDFRERISARIVETISVWCDSHKKSMVFGDLPEVIMRDWIEEFESVYYMEEMLKSACRELIMDHDID